jgi:hypothetical protein
MHFSCPSGESHPEYSNLSQIRYGTCIECFGAAVKLAVFSEGVKYKKYIFLVLS